MVHQLATLPLELLHAVASLLLRPDQAALARTCKSLNVLLTPSYGGDIELHFRGTHEGVNLDAKLGNEDDNDDEEPSPEERAEYPFWDIVKEPPLRKYSQIEFDGTNQAGVDLDHHAHIDGDELGTVGRASDMGNRRNLQFAKEEKSARVCFITPAPRWTELAQHVRSLCMSIGMDDGVIKVLSDLRNLRSLELVGLPIPEAKPWPSTAPEMRMPGLKNLKLRGFFPVAFLKAIFTNAETITHLNLGLLATKFDDEKNSCGILAGRFGGAQHDGDDDKDREEKDDDEDDDPQPWAFHNPIWLSDDLARGFNSLTHLHLVKPYSGYSSLDYGSLDEPPCATKSASMAKRGGGLGRHPVLPIGAAAPSPAGGGKGYGALRRLALRGIRIDGISTTSGGSGDGDEEVEAAVLPGIGGRALDNGALLRRSYPDCDVELVQNDVYGIYPYDGETYDCWDERRKEPRQDEGDGLLEDADYYRDYIRRYGPQWRIVD
ncbi:hypothetical protein PG997_005531 [Apiospora hydei]|uniref:F-box domain-containing protein n=1 Tax=Apiospora hydei TaxID=1337664 RepID=A0ABR1WP48_9PEZI